MTAKQAIQFAASRIGYYAPDDPLPGSEAGRWLAEKLEQPWLAGPSTTIWWCMCFASMCVYEGGGTLPGGPTYNTDIAVNAARKENRLVPVDKAEPGDLAIFDWSKATESTDHVGIIEANPKNGTLVCIEGNTSKGVAGSQQAGNGVWRRTRSTSLVRYVIRPTYETTTSGAQLDVDGVFGRLSTLEAQAQCGTPQDGEIWGQNTLWRQRLYAITSITDWTNTGSALIEALQVKCGLRGLDVDGILGPKTIRALQIKLGVDPDGWFGHDTAAALQAALNRGDVKNW